MSKQPYVLRCSQERRQALAEDLFVSLEIFGKPPSLNQLAAVRGRVMPVLSSFGDDGVFGIAQAGKGDPIDVGNIGGIGGCSREASPFARFHCVFCEPLSSRWNLRFPSAQYSARY
jgi:hypothetical protein